MAIYKIMRIYEVPGDTRLEATNRMMEALVLRVEAYYHVTDYVKGPDELDGKGHQICLEPQGWMTLVLDQLLGRTETKKKR